MIGQTISRYRVFEKLGEGGMGVVYKAEDTKLRRIVALKFLSPNLLLGDEDRKRFVQEAQASASLSHPNIATVFEIDETEGKTFIALEYIEGANLSEKLRSGPLNLEEALDIAIQTCGALQAAHEKDIVHRDIKSQNIMVTPKGQVKILDFGLAKLRKGSDVTKAGTTLGTIGYMSPEQLSGRLVDHRTDIWALGVVLYEMVAGRRPFSAEYDAASAYQVLNEQPEPLKAIRTGVPRELERIVKKAMAKHPNDRYQHADEMRVDLESLRRDSGEVRQQPAKLLPPLKSRVRAYGTATALMVLFLGGAAYFLSRPEEKTTERPSPGDETGAASDAVRSQSIAVLPFRNMSSDKEQDYFCDGITEQIITNLSNLRDLKVIARTSVMQFRNTEKTIPEIGKHLGVANVLEGSVRRSGRHLRITAQLVKADDGFHLWAKDYDRELKDVFAVQDDVSKAIVEALEISLTPTQSKSMSKRYTGNVEAFQLYLKGRYFWDKRTLEGMQRAAECFNQAISVDSSYALAYAGLADSYLFQNSLPRSQSMPLAKKAAKKALAIDDRLAEAHTTLGFVKMNYEFDLQGSENDFLHALELNPNYSVAHHFYSVRLSIEGRTEEGLREIKRALELDPLSLAVNWGLGMHFYLSRRYDEAIEQLRKTIQMEPNYQLAHVTLGAAYVQKAFYTDAISEFREAWLRSGSPELKASLGWAYAASGDEKEARKIVEELTKVPEHTNNVALIVSKTLASMGEIDQAFVWLDKALEVRDFGVFFLKVDPAFDPLREDRRFQAALTNIGLTE